MPMQTAAGTFSTGRDCSLSLIGGDGTRVDLSKVTNFTVKQLTHQIRSDLMNGLTIGADLSRGVDFDFEVERDGPDIDALIAGIESNWIDGGFYQVGTMYQFNNEPGGGTSTWQFAGCAFKLDSEMWKPNDTTKLRISGFASRRKQVA